MSYLTENGLPDRATASEIRDKITELVHLQNAYSDSSIEYNMINDRLYDLNRVYTVRKEQEDVMKEAPVQPNQLAKLVTYLKNKIIR